MSLFCAVSYFLEVDYVGIQKVQFYYRISGMPLKFRNCVTKDANVIAFLWAKKDK